MQRMLCIHGHFYQPPREDPWLREVLPEGSAAPGLNWNERICRESYAPLGWARRLDEAGKCIEIVNCYEWMSFNFGPTLLSWMEHGNPDAYSRILEGDRASLERWGHGNAMAQVHHHAIMPLAGELDKKVETAWGLADFEARFGRRAEGMWLAEAAVDTPTLEILAEQGVRFVVLAPRQAKEVAPLSDGDWTPVDEGSLDVTRAYRAELSSGRSIEVIFYHGPISQAVAFERLLENGESFWQRISAFFSGIGGAASAMLPMATDGETYGHHFMFGEMALAYVLAQAQFNRDQIELGNFGLWLEKHPPEKRVRLVEPSSWSCEHGVERWRSDCGCSAGGHQGWNQQWRAPLRQALDGLKAKVDAHFKKRGEELFQNPEQALLDYGQVLARSTSQKAFAVRHFVPKLSAGERQAAWRLLSMQQWALASFASCAWFFDDISRIEPMNGLTFAYRAMQLCEAAGGAPVDALEAALVDILSQASSNYPELGTGADLWRSMVRPRREGEDSLVAQAFLRLTFDGGLSARAMRSVEWEGVRVSLKLDGKPSEEENAPCGGKATILWSFEHEGDRYDWRFEPHESGDPLRGSFFVVTEGGDPLEATAYRGEELPWNKLQAVSLAQAEAAFEACWQEKEARLRQAARLFMPFQESQSTQNLLPLWRAHWPVLAWLYARGLDLPREVAAVREGGLDDMARLLREMGREHPDAELAGRRIVAHVLELLDSEPPLWDSAINVVQRVRFMELEVDWWPVLNRLWRMGVAGQSARGRKDRHKAAERLAEMLGFRMK